MPVVLGTDGKYHRVAGEAAQTVAAPITRSIPNADCAKCPLGRRPLCDAPRGELRDIIVVGEGPGYNEIKQQQFYVGKAGQLLWEGLRLSGLDKYSCGVNNATLCQPEGDSDFPTDALWCCRNRLIQELRASSPKMLIATGAQAMSSLLGHVSGIMSVQGQVMDYLIDNTLPVKLTATVHSAYVLRFSSAFYDFMNALVKARRFMEGDATVNVPPEAFERHIANDSDAVQLLERLASFSNIYADLETTGFSPYEDSIICISLAGRGNDDRIVRMGATFDWAIFSRVPKALGLLIHILEDKVITYWNGMFDCTFLRQYGIRASVGHDVMLKHYTLDERPLSQGLKPTARLLCNAPDWEAPLRALLPNKNVSYALLPFDLLAQYATLDACYTGTTDPIITKEMSEDNKFIYEKILLPATNVLMESTREGLLVDVERLEQVRNDLIIQLDELLANLRNYTNDPNFNPSSVPQAQWLCYEKEKLPLYRRKRSTARTVVEQYRREKKSIGWLLDFRSTRKMIGTYLDNLLLELDVNNYWHPNIRVNGTVTGRLASGQGSGERSRKSLNALGIPKEKGGIKKLVKAPPDQLVMEGDGSQMELRVLGALSHDRNMIADFQSGIDFHGILRDRIYHRGYEKKNYTHQEVLDAKTVAFGPPYGRGAESIAEQIKCSIKEAEELLEIIWGRYTEAILFLEAREVELKETGEVRSYYGRVRHWGLLTEDNYESACKEARNFSVQSPATDTNVQIMNEVAAKYGPSGLIKPKFPIHDSVLSYISRARREEAASTFKAYAERRAQELLNTEMPFVYEIGVGESWGDI